MHHKDTLPPEIRVVPAYLSTDNRMEEININSGDNPQNIQHLIYDIMPLHNTIPLAVLDRSKELSSSELFAVILMINRC